MVDQSGFDQHQSKESVDVVKNRIENTTKDECKQYEYNIVYLLKYQHDKHNQFNNFKINMPDIASISRYGQ